MDILISRNKKKGNLSYREMSLTITTNPGASYQFCIWKEKEEITTKAFSNTNILRPMKVDVGER